MFRGDILKILIEESKCSVKELSKKVEVSVSAIESYTTECENKKGTQPSLEVIEKFADFFCVPIDFLLGRYSLKEQSIIIMNFPKNFLELRHCAYEKYLLSLKTAHPIENLKDSTIEAPYPYNLVDAIIGYNICFILKEDNLAALEYALQTLSEKERKCISLYFKDLKNLEEISFEFDVTKERIRQLIARALRKLRHPSLCERIIQGWHTFEEIDEYAKKAVEEADERKTFLDHREEMIIKKEIAIDKKVKELERLGITEGELFLHIIRKEYTNINDIPLEETKISIRAFNCLARHGFSNIGEVVDCLENETERFTKIRNMGKKTYHEILDMLDNLFETKRYNDLFGKAMQ